MVRGETMSKEIIISLITLFGTIGSVIISNIANSSLIKYRIDQLEKKVTLHNNMIERVYNLEKEVAVMESEFNEGK